MSDEEVRQLHRLIDRRIRLMLGTAPPLELARGSVTSVDSTQQQVTALLDGADAPTRGIVYGSGLAPVVGDDIVVLRRRDGFLLLHSILGRA